MIKMNFKDFANKYCERQEQTPEGLKAILQGQKVNFNPTGWVLLECHMLDSSLIGSLTILPYGPNNSLKEVPTHPVSPRGIVSDMSVVIGILEASELGE